MAVNLWKYGDVEDGDDIWNTWNGGVPSQSSTVSWEETYSLRLSVTGALQGTYSTNQYIIEGSVQYTVSFYVYVTSATVKIKSYVWDQDDNEIATNSGRTYTVDTWVRQSLTFTTGADDTGVNIGWQQNGTSETTYIYIDGMMLETGASASTWVNYITENLWPNADLESGIDDWNDDTYTTIAHDDTQYWEQDYSLKATFPTEASKIVESDKKTIVQPETRYTMTVWTRSTNADLSFRISIYDQGDTALVYGSYYTQAADTWVRRELDFTTGVGDTGIFISFMKDADAETGDVYIDAVQVETDRMSTPWVNYDDSGGVVVTPTLGIMTLQGFNPVVGAAGGLWEIGAYIYDVLREVKVNPTLGTMTLQGYNPTVSASGAGADVEPTLGVMTLQGFNPTVGGTSSEATEAVLTEIARFNYRLPGRGILKHGVYELPLDGYVLGVGISVSVGEVSVANLLQVMVDPIDCAGTSFNWNPSTGVLRAYTASGTEAVTDGLDGKSVRITYWGY